MPMQKLCEIEEKLKKEHIDVKKDILNLRDVNMLF